MLGQPDKNTEDNLIRKSVQDTSLKKKNTTHEEISTQEIFILIYLF